MMRYTAETYTVLSHPSKPVESGSCVKLGDDTVCDVYHGGHEMAELIAKLLNSHDDMVEHFNENGMEHAP